MNCWKQMDWPSIPPELAEGLIDSMAHAENIRRPDAKGRFFDQRAAPPELVEWVHATLPIDRSYTVILQAFRGILHCPVHKDNIRDFSWNYLLTEDPASTVFYSDQAEEIDRVIYQPRRWYWHNSKVYHGVQNMQTNRVAVCIFRMIPKELRPLEPTLLRANLPGAIKP